jgi:hypothetical protein
VSFVFFFFNFFQFFSEQRGRWRGKKSLASKEGRKSMEQLEGVSLMSVLSGPGALAQRPEDQLMGMIRSAYVIKGLDDVVDNVQRVFIFSVPFLIRLFDFCAGGTDTKPHTERPAKTWP